MKKIGIFLQRWWMVLVILAALPVYYFIAVSNERSVNYLNNDFFTFWLSGRMNWTGGHPYSSLDWVGAHHANGATWIPNQIFPYPLPLVLLMAPLGLLEMPQAYIALNIVSQVLLALATLWLATHWRGPKRQVFAILLIIAITLNSNIHLMLLTGTISTLFLVFLLLALFFMEQNQPIIAGIMLSFLALKPSLLTIVGLIGLWLLICRNWRAIAGIIIGGIGLLVVGLLQDPLWVEKFRGVGANLFNMRLGNQPTLISYTRLACGGGVTCALVLYVVLFVVLTGLFAWLVWQKRNTLTPLTVFSAAIALGVLLPPYIWSYDYALLVIPLAYICFELVRRRSSFLPATLFLFVLDALSLGMAILFSISPESPALSIQRDMWSIWVGLFVCISAWWMVFRAPAQAQP